jgi:hypothetical protein
MDAVVVQLTGTVATAYYTATTKHEVESCFDRLLTN